ncbi:MAG: TolC family protein [Balneolales bacterium]
MYKLITCTICLLFLVSNTSAQQITSVTLDEAIQIALENNVQIKLSQNAMERQENAVFRSRTEFLPSLSSSINSGRTVGRQFDQSTVRFDDFAADRISSSLSTQVTLFSGWRNINNLRASRSSQDASVDLHQRTEETVIFNTAAQFLAIILDEELLGIAEDNLETTKGQLEQVEAQVEVGMRPIVDLYNQEAAVASSELAVIQRTNALNFSKLNLIGTLQIDPFVDYEFISPDIDDVEFQTKDFNLTELVNHALANRSDIRATEATILAQHYSLEATKGALYPTINLGANVSSSYNSLQQFNFSDQFFESNINRGLSVNIQIPIFNRYNARTNIQQQEINYKNAQLDLENLQIEIIQEIRQAYNDYITETQQLETTAKLELAAEKAFETERERYNVGSSTLIELNDANNRYVSAVSERIQAQYRFIFQEKVLDFYIGRISAEEISNILE